jgi:hypothetical protein
VKSLIELTSALREEVYAAHWRAYLAEHAALLEYADNQKTLGDVSFTDRYDALGIDRPDPKTVCRFGCEGTGFIPVKGWDWEDPDPERAARVAGLKFPENRDDPREIQLQELWQTCEENEPTDDGWHFVTCPECKGTGRRDGKSVWKKEQWNASRFRERLLHLHEAGTGMHGSTFMGVSFPGPEPGNVFGLGTAFPGINDKEAGAEKKPPRLRRAGREREEPRWRRP